MAVYEEEDDDCCYGEDDEDDFFEVECPNCQTKFSLDLSDDTVEGDEE